MKPTRRLLLVLPVAVLTGCVAPNHHFQFDPETGRISWDSTWEESTAEWEGAMSKPNGFYATLKVKRGTKIDGATQARIAENKEMWAGIGGLVKDIKEAAASLPIK